MASDPAYCTILAGNYLPKAMSLADSLARHHPDSRLSILFIDVRDDADLPDLPGVSCLSTAVLGLSEREVLRLATGYDLVELATAVKPLLLKRLLADHEQVAYLDPDTFVTSPMVELPVDLAATDGGILLTPHFLDPVPEDSEFSEGHLLTVGIYNLGFCAVDRRALPFLDWWWGHLEEQCLCDPLSGLFVDQKWMDIGAVLFRAGTWRHRGYNTSVANLHERQIVADADGYAIAPGGDRLRLYHFHAFDTNAPNELSTRSDGSTAHLRAANPALEALCVEYAKVLSHHEDSLPPAAPYPYARDTKGRPLSRHLRRAYRLQAAVDPDLPSPFLAADAEAYDAWRRRARRFEAKEIAGDAAKSLRLMFPEEYGRAKARFPGLARALRQRLVRPSGIWG